VVQAPAAPDCPDAVFIEDTAVVLDEMAIITRPGAETRRQELDAIGPLLAAYRPVVALEAPATLDGGDVLLIGRTIYVGQSSRTNREGINQLERFTKPHGYRVVPLNVTGCLHLKSAVTAVAQNTVLLNPAWIAPAAFSEHEVVLVHPDEPNAANAVRVGPAVLYSSEYPNTQRALERRGLRVATVDCSELAKAEGAVTCCSLVFNAPATNGS
jgi:dimethylargininase